ncbi:flagellar biosynthesis protein FlhA [Pelagicoccus sp. SDUM812002]|uniref:flagellar biosynthesis protein FlhA n=1 Tax=Pelagicoccus sp. SDUM812002 TaxID=3041266 RepID=UPI00280CE136|nr:flagellar biosynthesis protein FlhA [Pelagicoccus sp. SDUM812002]MDQ8185956.1 flagellar biosynthesis protein FlhA [Pelagicoccus sp. SDUM812002]
MNDSAAQSFSLSKVFAFLKRGDTALVACLFGTVLLLVLPLPPLMLDILLAASVGASLLILLIIVYVKEPSEFSGFPTVLLGVTLFRLGLNVASTRLILLDGYAGSVIDSFGSFVVRNNYLVGTVIFLILVAINFIVITKGAGRIAEVAARFTLDAMPGKQMAIDAELNAGIIDEVKATKRREKVQKEADFYGSMDGASKFVRGDATAGILITVINVLGGIAIGMWQQDMSFQEALQRFTLLSIGDGLVSQIPALVISLAAGLLVTRNSGEDEDLGSQIGGQVAAYPKALGVLSGMLGLFGIIPGMPFIPFFIMSAGVGIGAIALSRTQDKKKAEEKLKEVEEEAKSRQNGAAPGGHGDDPNGSKHLPAEFEKLIEVDVFALEIGFNLLTLADKAQGGDLLERVTGVRKTLARELGIVVPPIAVRDNMELEGQEYRFLLHDKEVARGEVMPNRWMAMNVTGSEADLKGIPTKEPVFGIDAVWVDDDEKKNAEINGFSVVDCASVLITHLSECLKTHAHHLLSRQDTQKLVDHVEETHPALVQELMPDLVSIGTIHRVFQNLLKEGVAIRNLTLILEGIGDFAPISKNPDDLSEYVRRRTGEFFVAEYESEKGVLKAITMDPRLEQVLASKVQRTNTDYTLSLDPQLAQYLLRELAIKANDQIENGLLPILVTAAEIRLPFKRFFEPSLPKLNILSYQELPSSTEIMNHAIILFPDFAQQEMQSQARANGSTAAAAEGPMAASFQPN